MNPLRYVAAFVAGIVLTLASEWAWRTQGPKAEGSVLERLRGLGW